MFDLNYSVAFNKWVTAVKQQPVQQEEEWLSEIIWIDKFDERVKEEAPE